MSLPGASVTTVRPDRPGSEAARRDEADVGTQAAVAAVGSSESPAGSGDGWLGVGMALVLLGGLAVWALVLRRRVDG
jgi:hypothetical protein